MPVGDHFYLIRRKKVIKFCHKLLGTIDLHTHIRLNPLIKFFTEYFRNYNDKEIRILEIGCDDGINAFEIYKIVKSYGKKIRYIGVDLNEKSIEDAKKVAMHNRLDDFSFYKDDGINFLEKKLGAKFGLEQNIDIIFFIDIIEHIKNVSGLLEFSNRYLRKGGIYAISVPTPLYPKVFGRKYHSKRGHIVDGYYLENLDNLFINGMHCQRVMHRYNTGLISNIGCYLYYRSIINIKCIDSMKSLVLYPFKFLDLINNSKMSCSLFVVYKKR